MKKFLALVVLVLSTACAGIDPGYAGVEVIYYGSNKGVNQTPLTVGLHPYNPWTKDILAYPVFVQTTRWTQQSEDESPVDESVTFNDRDGLPINVDVSLSYQLAAAKAPAFYEKFRVTELDDFTHGYMRNVARDAFNEEGVRLSAEQIYGSEKEALIAAVRKRVNDEVLQFGISVEQFGVIGSMRLPSQVMASIEAKIKATQDAQRVENELRTAEAQARKVVAEAKGEADSAIEKARGQSEANKTLTSSLTSTLLEWRRLTIQEQAMQKWNGQLPSMMTGDNALPMINITPR